MTQSSNSDGINCDITTVDGKQVSLSTALYKIPRLLFSQMLLDFWQGSSGGVGHLVMFRLTGLSTVNRLPIAWARCFRLVKLRFQPTCVHVPSPLFAESESPTLCYSLTWLILYMFAICFRISDKTRHLTSVSVDSVYRCGFSKPGSSIFHGFSLICPIVGKVSWRFFSTRKEPPFTRESAAEQPRLIWRHPSWNRPTENASKDLTGHLKAKIFMLWYSHRDTLLTPSIARMKTPKGYLMQTRAHVRKARFNYNPNQ